MLHEKSWYNVNSIWNNGITYMVPLVIFQNVWEIICLFAVTWKVPEKMCKELLSMVVESGLNAMKKDARGLSRVAAGNPGFPRLVPVTSGSFSGCLWEVRDTMELGEASQDSTGFAAMEEGLISRPGRNLRVPLHFWLRLQGPCRVGTGESGLVFCGGMELRLTLALLMGWQHHQLNGHEFE